MDARAAEANRSRRATRSCTRRCSRGCSATSASSPTPTSRTSARAGMRFYLHPGSGLARRRRQVGPRRRADRDHAPVRALRREDRARMDRGGRGRPCRTATISSRTGRRSAARSSRASASQLYGLTLVARRPRVASARSIRRWRARSSSARRWCRARCARAARFSRTTARWSPKSPSSSTRRGGQDVLVDDETIAAFYAERVPAGIHSAAAFERWRGDAEQRDPRLLFLTPRRSDAPCRAGGDRGTVSGDARARRGAAAAQVSLRARASARRLDR